MFFLCKMQIQQNIIAVFSSFISTSIFNIFHALEAFYISEEFFELRILAWHAIVN